MNDVSSLLWAQLWQVTAVAAVVLLVVKVFAKDRPHLAHALWVMVLLKCITPPVFSSQLSPFSWWSAETQQAVAVADPMSMPIPSNAIDGDGAIGPVVVDAVGFGLLGREKNDSEVHEGSTTKAYVFRNTSADAFDWKRSLIGVWLLGAFLCLCFQLVRLFRFQLLISRTTVPSPPNLEDVVSRLSKQLALKRTIRTVTTTSSISPAVVGLFRPTVLLPVSLVKQKIDKAIEPLLAHELIHIRRGDLWWALLQAASGILFWFHPLIRHAVGAMTYETERSCDEETIASLGCKPADYANALLDVLEQKQLQPVPALPGVKPVEITSARLERVMKLGHGSHKRTPWWIWMVLLAACAVALPGAGLASNPTQEELPELLPKAGSVLLPEVEAKQENNAVTITRSYDIKDIIETMRKEHPTVDVQVLELQLINHLKAFPINDPMAKQDPQKKTVLFDGKIIAGRNQEGHTQLTKQLARIRENGFLQIVLETRILEIPKGNVDQIVWGESPAAALLLAKNGEIGRELKSDPNDSNVNEQNALVDKYPVRLAALLEDQVDDEVHRLRKANVHTESVFESALDKEQLTEFVKNSGKIRHAPTVILFNGSGGVIRDQSLTPFVTNVVPIKSANEDGLVAFQPVISLLPDGTSMTISSEIIDGEQFRISGDMVISQINRVETFTFHPNGTPAQPGEELEEGVTIQVPVVSVSKLDFDSTIKVGQTLALRSSNPMNDKRDLVLLITPRLVDEPASALSEENIPRDGVKLIDNPSAVQQGSATKGTATVEQPVRLPTPDHFIRQKQFEELRARYGVSATPDEIDAEIVRTAETRGLSAQQWMQIVGQELRIDDLELRKMIERDLCFRKLSPKVQLEFLPNKGGELLFIRSKDPGRNVNPQNRRPLMRGEPGPVVHADVEITEDADGILLKGNDLEFTMISENYIVEPWASADHATLELTETESIITLENGLYNFDGPPIAAGTIRIHSRGASQLEFAGNVRFEIDTATFSADFMKPIDNGILFRGNVKVKFAGSKELNITAEELQLGDDGTLTVNGIELGPKIEF